MDPLNAKFVCCAGCGIDNIGTASGGTEHWASGTFTNISIVTAPAAFNTPKAFRLNPTAAVCNALHTFATLIASPATLVARFDIQFTTLPTANVQIFNDNASVLGVQFNQSDSTLRAGAAIGTVAASGIAVTTGVKYTVDFKVVINTTRTVDIQVNGSAGAQYSVAGTASASTAFRFGQPTTAWTGDYVISNILVSGTSTDYPIGPGNGVALYPTGDSVHVYDLAGDFGKGSGGATALATPASSETTTWQSLSNPLTLSIPTNFVAGVGAAVLTEWLQWTMDDLPGNASTINGVMWVVTSHSAAATANSITMQQVLAADNSIQRTGGDWAWISVDLSEITITAAVNVRVRGPGNPGAAWDVAGVNATMCRFSSSDVTPDVFVDGACMEVDYVPTVAAAANVPYTNPMPALIAQ